MLLCCFVSCQLSFDRKKAEK